MVDSKTFKQMALALPGTEEQGHFEKTAFKVKKKRIFATLTADGLQACVRLREIDQSVFCAFDKTVIYPVPNKWAKQGWTMVELKKVRKDMLKDLLTVAHEFAKSPS